MKHRLMTVLSALALLLPGCSYVSDYVEGAITDRASFSIDAVYDGSKVTVTWDETGGGDFAGYEIYRTEYPNDEYSGYILVANKNDDASLGVSTTTSYEDDPPFIPFGTGKYFYRVGIINWDDDESFIYDSDTSIYKISGYAEVVID